MRSPTEKDWYPREVFARKRIVSSQEEQLRKEHRRCLDSESLSGYSDEWVLSKQGIPDETLIISTTDHGDLMGEHRMARFSPDWE